MNDLSWEVAVLTARMQHAADATGKAYLVLDCRDTPYDVVPYAVAEGDANEREVEKWLVRVRPHQTPEVRR